VGKTWLACVLGQQACRDNATVIYKRAPRLFSELELAHGDGSYPRLFRNLTKTDLLIIDDWGPDRLTASQRRDLMEIVEDRYGTGATLITSQLPVDAWHEIIGDPTFADAILDRVRHCARTNGASMAHFTTPIASTSTAHQCAKPNRKPLTKRLPTETNKPPLNCGTLKVAISSGMDGQMVSEQVAMSPGIRTAGSGETSGRRHCA